MNELQVKVEKKVGSGDAKDVICAAVDKLEADILVMGSHDYGFIKRSLSLSLSYLWIIKLINLLTKLDLE